MSLRSAQLPLFLTLAMLPAGCALVAPRAGVGDEERLAGTVTISRDQWGVPAIHAPTDAGIAFGLAWAQAEDNYWQIEEDYIHALGRAAEYYGEQYLAADLVRRAFDIPRLSREEYEREPADRRAVWDAYAAGLNHYLRTSGVQPRLITRWEPWMPFAVFRAVRAGNVLDGVRLGELDDAGFQLVGRWDEAAAEAAVRPARPAGSNTWAVSPARSASGRALLFQNPHVGFFGAGQRYEALVESETGWHVRGFAILGTPVIRSGHTAAFAWSHTNSAADNTDVYAVTFDDASEPLAYRYDGEWRRATEWQDTLRVNTAAGVETRVVSFRRTHHGPIVARRGREMLAVRVARMEDGGSLQQWYALNRARDLAGFMEALAMRAFTISNTMYADTAGNIYYVHGNVVPRRPAGYDWRLPVPGNTAATEWQGYHDHDELPQLLNPGAGWLQNTNATPFRATADGYNLDADAYPAYMAPESDNARARASRRLLQAADVWTFEAWQRAAFDTYANEAEPEIRRLVLEWEQVGGQNPNRAMRVDEAVDILRAWDHASTVESEAMTIFVLWQERLLMLGEAAPLARFRALEDAVGRLEREHGTVRVSWGEVNRLQRVHTSGREPFRDDLPSLPVPGAPEIAGTIFRFTAAPGPDGRRYGRSGHTWVSVVELGPRVRSRSIVQFGQSADPASPHFFDQAPLYVRGEFKDATFTREDALRAARRSYRPGPAQRR